MKVKLSLVERTLNALTACNRKRSGDVLTRMKEEAAVLEAAFEEVRQKARDEYQCPARCCMYDEFH